MGSNKIDCIKNPKGSKTAKAIFIGNIGSYVTSNLEESIFFH